MPLPIIFEDNYILVINKPAGLITTPAESVKEKTLAEILIQDYGISIDRGGVVHRLDKDTSGVLIAAKTLESLEALQAQFKQRTIKKQYTALVHGFANEQGIIEGDVGRNPGNREKFTVLENGKEAVTEYICLNHLMMNDEKKGQFFFGFNKNQIKKMERGGYGKFSLVKAFPQTGRTHQIRVHLKHINLPIVADDTYGGRKTARLDRRWCARQFLHASAISFLHPKSQEKMNFEAPLPEDLKKALACLEVCE